MDCRKDLIVLDEVDLFSVDVRSSVGSVRHMLRDHGLTLGGGDLVVDWGTFNLGDGVAMLNLHGNSLDDRVIHTMLGDDLTASVLDGGLDGVSDSMDSGSHNWGSGSKRSSVISSQKVLKISLLRIIEQG